MLLHCIAIYSGANVTVPLGFEGGEGAEEEGGVKEKGG